MIWVKKLKYLFRSPQTGWRCHRVSVKTGLMTDDFLSGFFCNKHSKKLFPKSPKISSGFTLTVVRTQTQTLAASSINSVSTRDKKKRQICSFQMFQPSHPHIIIFPCFNTFLPSWSHHKVNRSLIKILM